MNGDKTAERHPGSAETMNLWNDWEPGSLPFSKKFGWQQWGLFGILLDYILYYAERGILVEIGVGVTAIFMTKAALKYNRRTYHCDIQVAKIENPRSIPGWFKDNAFFFVGSSDEFFAEVDLPLVAVGVIDGDHTYEQARRDFFNLLPKVVDNGYIFLHDTYPGNSHKTEPTECGDVYKLRQELETHPDLDVFTFPYSAWDVGLTMVRKCPENRPHFQRKGINI